MEALDNTDINEAYEIISETTSNDLFDYYAKMFPAIYDFEPDHAEYMRAYSQIRYSIKPKNFMKYMQTIVKATEEHTFKDFMKGKISKEDVQQDVRDFLERIYDQTDY